MRCLNMLLEKVKSCIYITTLCAYDALQLSSCTSKAAQGPEPNSFSSPLINWRLQALPLPSFSNRPPLKISGSTRSKKEANNDTEPKPLSNEEPTASPAYDRFKQEPYRAANGSSHLQQDGSNFAKWVAGLNRVLCVAFISELLVDDLPSLLENRSPQENRAISHFISSMLPPDFALCIGAVLAWATAKEFFDAIKARCCPGNCFQKTQVVRELLDLLVENDSGQHKPNNTIILSLHKTFSIFKKLGVDTDKLDSLLAQAPASLD
ncbi:hypothetical protein O181_067693 [Austropuccinia psidii MF-1]|uniref:Uncharacterized protein n=1 Tax=Austropuccinia psidii MF-1 TaxID=1389203 RepID=A0A9Q3I4R7_9BASI|nr:hypothetical protein [Austropuccinia psidii MF-1]